MEIAGYEIENKYVAAGAAGIGILFLLTRNKGSTEPETAYLRPAEGLNWGDIIGTADPGKLIGPGGSSGIPGPPGVPGTPGGPGGPGTPGTPGSGHGGGGGKDHGKGGGKGRGSGHGGGGGGGRNHSPHRPNANDNPNRNQDDSTPKTPDRPHMPDTRKDVNDPRTDTPKQADRRANGNNRINTVERDHNKDNKRQHDSAKGGKIRTGDVSGNVHLDASGGKQVKHGKNAHANASGGKIHTGNIDKGTHGDISAHGGTAIADSSGGTGNRNRRKKRARGAGEVVDTDDGFGRMDGNGGTPTGEVNLHPQKGGSIGGFMPVSHPLMGAGSTATIRRGESLKGLAKRTLGDERFWPRIVRLNNGYQWGDKEIVAGTTFRIG